MFQVVQAVQVVVQGWARMDGMDAIPAYARTAHNGLLQKKKYIEEDRCRIIPHIPLTTQSVRGLD